MSDVFRSVFGMHSFKDKNSVFFWKHKILQEVKGKERERVASFSRRNQKWVVAQPIMGLCTLRERRVQTHKVESPRAVSVFHMTL